MKEVALELTSARWKRGMQGEQRMAFQQRENYVTCVTHEVSFTMGSAMVRVFQDIHLQGLISLTEEFELYS